MDKVIIFFAKDIIAFACRVFACTILVFAIALRLQYVEFARNDRGKLFRACLDAKKKRCVVSWGPWSTKSAMINTHDVFVFPFSVFLLFLVFTSEYLRLYAQWMPDRSVRVFHYIPEERFFWDEIVKLDYNLWASVAPLGWLSLSLYANVQLKLPYRPHYTRYVLERFAQVVPYIVPMLYVQHTIKLALPKDDSVFIPKWTPPSIGDLFPILMVALQVFCCRNALNGQTPYKGDVLEIMQRCSGFKRTMNRMVPVIQRYEDQTPAMGQNLLGDYFLCMEEGLDGRYGFHGLECDVTVNHDTITTLYLDVCNTWEIFRPDALLMVRSLEEANSILEQIGTFPGLIALTDVTITTIEDDFLQLPGGSDSEEKDKNGRPRGYLSSSWSSSDDDDFWGRN